MKISKDSTAASNSQQARPNETLTAATQFDLLVARAADGYPEAVAQVITQLEDVLLDDARNVLGEAMAYAAEDMVQELGERLLDEWLKFDRGRRDGMGFLRRAVRRIAREWRREIEASLAVWGDEGWE